MLHRVHVLRVDVLRIDAFLVEQRSSALTCACLRVAILWSRRLVQLSTLYAPNGNIPDHKQLTLHIAEAILRFAWPLTK